MDEVKTLRLPAGTAPSAWVADLGYVDSFSSVTGPLIPGPAIYAVFVWE